MSTDPPEGHPLLEHRRKGAVAGQQGQAAHVPTDDIRANVELYAMWGLSYAQIAGVLDMGERTLRKYYSEELARGRAKGVKLAAGKLFQKVLDGNLTALIFFLKTRPGGAFSEKHGHQMLDDEGEPIDLSAIRLADTDDATLAAVSRFLIAALAASGRGPVGESPGRADEEGAEEDRGGRRLN